jgi:hypothetical protein
MGQIKKVTTNILFNESYLDNLLNSKKNRLKSLIESLQEDYISKVDENKLTEDLIEEYKTNPIILDEKNINRSKLIDIKVDVTNEPGRDVRRGGENFCKR